MQLCPAIVKMKKRIFSRAADYICWYKGVSRDDKSRDNWSGVYIYEIIIEKNIVMTSHSKERKNGGHLNEQVSNFKQKKRKGYLLLLHHHHHASPKPGVRDPFESDEEGAQTEGSQKFLSVINRANICFRRISVCQLKSE